MRGTRFTLILTMPGPASAAVAFGISLVLSPVVPAAADPDPPRGTSEISGVRVAPSGSMVGYDLHHEVLALMDRRDGFPHVRIRREDHPGLGRMWAHGGTSAAWLAPPGQYQLDPFGTLVEDVHVTDSVNWEFARPMEPGDRVGVGMATTAWDAVLSWDRDRTAAEGRLEWELTTDVRRVSAEYRDLEGELDVLLFRADIVARGGDVAAGAGRRVPPLVIDLPDAYPIASYAGAYGLAYPYTHYVRTFDFRLFPALGKGVLTAEAQGYLPEARRVTLPNGAEMKEWHLPLVGVFAFARDGTTLEPQGALHLGGPGEVLTVANEATRRLGLRAGGPVRFGPSAPAPAGEEPASTGEEGTDGQPVPVGTQELESASRVSRSLAEPVQLTAGGGRFGLTVDPDLRGEGVLALREVRRNATGRRYAHAVAVPAVEIDGEMVTLTRDRLTDLRVVPRRLDTVTLTFTSSSNTMPIRNGSPFLYGGFSLDAIYDLGRGRRAVVQMYAPTAFSVAPPDAVPGTARAGVTVLDRTGAVVPAAPLQYVELPADGPITVGGQAFDREFSARMEWRNTATPQLVAGRHTFHGTIDPAPAWASRSVQADGLATVVRAGGSVLGRPAPNPEAALAGDRVGIFFGPPPSEPTGFSMVRTTIASEPLAPAPAPKPLGTLCGEPQVTDLAAPDAPPASDVVEGWLDADPAAIYATIRVRDLPAQAPPATTLQYSFHWRFEHSGRYARATLNPAGQWAFDQGTSGGLGFTSLGGPMTGEVRTGPDGLIRIAVPRSVLGYRDDELLRETSAHAWATAVSPFFLTHVDEAPQGSDVVYGDGHDYEVGRCE